ncbi:N-acyl-D-amino-acid deacylase [Saonia flava]|uniref:N-acyl-D-amino-acid deacylase n=1 Tax=Saonia flava TaxID=523696 RepID=A0A846QQT3_9FLAO|nr:D-aminoacylase [Saonia flava]NJB71386.1 N-acyl-D-amino-acid deacylase [Saonia flava]
MKFFVSLIVAAFILSCNNSPQYDTVIRNGTIYDGTGDKPYVGDVAIKNDRIFAVGDVKGNGQNEIDATGKAVSPGFINMLSWANISLLEDGRSQGDIRQGVTLLVMGEGSSMGPLNEEMKKDMLNGQQEIKFDVPWTTLGEYLSHLEEKGVSTNVTSFVGNGTLRRHVLGYDNRKPTPQELEQMKALLAKAMEEGAVGVSSSLLYAPSMHSDTEELIELSKVASAYDGMYISHIRSEGNELIESVDEVLSIAKEADIRAEIYHLKASSEDNWPKLDTVFTMIDNARSKGLEITADMYTYNASSTGLHVMLPEWVREGGVENMLERLRDPLKKEKAIKEIYWRVPAHGVLFVGFKNPELRKFLGKRLDEVAKEMNLPEDEAIVELILKDQSRIQVVYFSMSEDNIDKKIQQPWMSFCSDAGSYSTEGVFLNQSTHPRAYGSFIRVLGLFSRDKKLFPLEEGIRRLTSFPANNLKIKDRGLLKENYFADVVIFDPLIVNDKATFEKPHQYAVGVEYVWVNGMAVLKNGEHTGTNAGRFVKGPGATK